MKLARLRTLHGRYREDPDMLLMVAGQMPGGWTSKDVKRLLLKHGLVEAKREACVWAGGRGWGQRDRARAGAVGTGRGPWRKAARQCLC